MHSRWHRWRVASVSASLVLAAGQALAQHTDDATSDEQAGSSGTPAAQIRVGLAPDSPQGFRMHKDWSDLDRFPTDVDDDAGIFILNQEGNKMARIYGSMRARAYWDDQELPDPWVIDIANTPAVKGPNEDWSFDSDVKESRIGMDVDVKDLLAVRSEFDFRGSSDQLRIRHMFLRTDHWVIGKNWTAFNTINYLPLALDYHSAGAHVGKRTNQIKYLNGFGNWRYHVSLEDNSPQINAPDAVNAKENNVIPNLAGHIEYRDNWGQVRVATLVAPNRVSSDVGDDNDLGVSVQAGFRWAINDSNVLKAHAMYMDGQNSMMADYTSQNLDMIYDPIKGEFRNVESVGGQFGIEHYWRPDLSTTLAGGFTDVDEQDFEPDDAFDKGYKGLINLIWKPRGRLQGLLVGTEFVYVKRENKAIESNDMQRVIFAIFYDF